MAISLFKSAQVSGRRVGITPNRSYTPLTFAVTSKAEIFALSNNQFKAIEADNHSFLQAADLDTKQVFLIRVKEGEGTLLKKNTRGAKGRKFTSSQMVESLKEVGAFTAEQLVKGFKLKFEMNELNLSVLGTDEDTKNYLESVGADKVYEIKAMEDQSSTEDEDSTKDEGDDETEDAKVETAQEESFI